MNLSTRMLFGGAALAAVLMVTVGFIVSRQLSNLVSQNVSDQFSEFIFDSIESGPLVFARMHSREIGNQQLNLLMSTSNVEKRNIFEVKIASLSDPELDYASWRNQNIESAACPEKVSRTVTFPDAIDKFEISIFRDQCGILPEQEMVSSYMSFGVLALVSIAGILFLMVLSPILKSIQMADQILIRLNDSKTKVSSNGIRVTPVQNLVDIAIKVVSLERQLGYADAARQVAHDIRAPLGALDLVASKAQSLPSDVQSLLKNAIERINGIAQDLLAIGNSSHESQFDLRDLTRKVASERQIEISSPENSELIVRGSKIQLGRVISNVLSNAIEASNGRGNVEVQITSNDGMGEIAISDSGPGISQELLRRLGQEQVSAGKDGGSGLGLFHAFKTVKSYGGSIRIDSNLGAGTTVRIRIPIQAPTNKHS